MYRYYIIFAGLCFSFLSCGSSSSQTQADTTVVIKQLAPHFNADSAYTFVKQQVDFGPRIPGSTAHQRCAQYLKNTFVRLGAKVLVQEQKVSTYDHKLYTLKNIIASYAPEKKNRVLISAHWDARPISDQDPSVQKPFDAANDGASGVGIILEMARQIQQKNPALGVDFILWDLEDYGKANDSEPFEPSWCVGSQYWAKHPHQKNYKVRFGINLDMVGGVNAVFTQDEISRQYAPAVVNKVWHVAQEIGYSSYFPNEISGAIIDDHFWMNKAGIPTADIIHFSDQAGFYQYWHTQNDKMEFIDTQVLKAVGQTVLEVVFRER